VAFLLPVVFSPSVQATYWSPAAALCLVVVGVGVPLAVRGAIAGDLASRVAVLLAVVGLASALASRSHTLAFFGLYNWGTGWLFMVALVGAWAVGRSLDPRGHRLVENALLAAVAVNAAIAIAETVIDLSAFQLGRYGDRAPGTMGNPIHLGAFLAAGLALAAPRFATAPRRWVWFVVLAGAGAQTSGSRFSLIVTVAVAAWVVWRFRLRIGAMFVVSLLAGAALGAAASSVGGGATVTERVATSAGNGITPRVDTWTAGLRAGVRRPVLGYGPGQFRTATSPHRTVAIARAEGTERLFVDAHNIVVEYIATVGFAGAALLTVWLALSVAGGSGPLLVFALAVLANHLIEPQSVRTTPVALLALGAAMPPFDVPSLHRATRASIGALAVAGLAAGAWLLVGDFHLDQARLDFDRGHARTALRMLPRWSEPATIRARISLFDGRVHRDLHETDVGVAWLRRAAARDPSDPALWNALGEWQLTRDRPDEAAPAFRTAVRWNPVSSRALNRLADIENGRGHIETALALLRRSLAADPAQAAVRRRAAALETRRGGGPKATP
jgi:O-antigen ligase